MCENGETNVSLTESAATHELDEFDLDGDYLTPPAPCEEFDQVVGELENILVEDDFLKLQNDLLEKHYHHFEDTEENKLIYTDIFYEYTSTLEEYIEQQLVQRIPGFQLDEFLDTVQERRVNLGREGDVFELLYTLSDFMSFKELFVDYAKKEEEQNS